MQEAIAKNGELHIAAVGLTSCRDIVIAIDRHGNPLGNAILWMDTRAKKEAEEIAAQLEAAIVHRKTGMIPGPTFPACKILWLKKNRPEQIKNCTYFLQPRDYVFYRLTGELLTDYSMASRTMMFDQETNTWWDAVFDLLEIKTLRFPELSSFQYGFYQGDVYLIQNNQAFKIPDKNAYYKNDFSYVWQCEGVTCGFMLSFFSLGTAIEYITYWGLPFCFVFDIENVGNVDEMQLSSAVNK